MATEPLWGIINRICPHCGQEVEMSILWFTEEYNGQRSDRTHWTVARCRRCLETSTFIDTDPQYRYHTGGSEPLTCNRGKICEKCGAEYDILDHDWGEWANSLNGTHKRVCKRLDCCAVDRGNCSGDSNATCVRWGICSTCGGRYFEGHKIDSAYSSDAAGHWKACVYCNGARTDEDGHTLEENPMPQFLKSPADCVSPAVYYKSCAVCGYIDKTLTFVSSATTTRQFTHWYGEWTGNGDGTHDASCRREGCRHTAKVECTLADYTIGEEAATVCAVCGEVSDGARLALLTGGTAAEQSSLGKLTLRMGETQSGERILSVGFERGGRLPQPAGEIQITLPAKLLDGYTLRVLNADGTETELPFTINGDETAFTLNFEAQADRPAAVIRLVPAA